MIVIRSAICKHNCRSPEVLFLDFEFTPGLGFVVGGLYNSGLNRTELVFLDGWECTPSIVGLWSLPGSNSTGRCGRRGRLTGGNEPFSFNKFQLANSRPNSHL